MSSPANSIDILNDLAGTFGLSVNTYRIELVVDAREIPSLLVYERLKDPGEIAIKTLVSRYELHKVHSAELSENESPEPKSCPQP